jgi:hypothetical protein
MPRLLMTKGTVHACGPDPLGFSWEFDPERRCPVAEVAQEVGQRFINRDPQLYQWADKPMRKRKEA